ncbi:MAG: TrmH family RNA methyltransferase [Microbacteriaceae bacterium]
MISNTNDPAVKAVKRLAQRSRRDDAGVFLVEGPQAVRELLQHAPESAVDVFYTAAFKERFASIVALAEGSPATVDEVSEKVLEEMADTVTPQGVIAVAQIQRKSLTDIEGATLIAICHEVRDPGNAGTVIRAADAAGADAVILTGDSVDLHNPKLVRSSTGSIFHLPIVEHQDLADVVELLSDRGIRVLAAAADGELIPEIRGLLAQPTAWLFGNEARGLDDTARELADAVVSVPIFGKAESLNLATAASVCLYASAFEQRA